MIRHHETISVAESVTSGHIQASLSLAENAREFFHGGITAYNLGQKSRHLYVEAIHALQCNCVSQQVASEMARNVCRLFSSHWGIGITGYAAPVPEKGIEDLFSYYAISHNDQIVESGMIESAKSKPIDVQIFYANHALKSLAGHLKKTLPAQ